MSPPPPPLTVSIASSQNYKVGDIVSVSWNNATHATAKDWIAMVPAGAHYTANTWPGKTVAPWFYTDGAVAGTKTLVAPAQGSYELVYLVNDSFTELARSSAFTISPATTVSDSLSAPSSVVAGQPLTVSWVKTGSLTAKDWIAIVPTGQQWVAGNPWVYTGGVVSGSKNIIAPALPGGYDLVYLVNDTPTVAIRQSGLTITSPSLVALTPGTQTLKAGASLSISWYVAGTVNAKDWVALVPQGQAWTSVYPWFYIDAARSGTKTITAPTALGIYDLVYFANDNPSMEVYRSSVVTVSP